METTDAGLIVPEGTLPTNPTETWSVRETRKLEAVAEMFAKRNLLWTVKCGKCNSITLMAFSTQQHAYKLGCKCQLRVLPIGRKA
jgi:phage gp46-like protein